MAQTTIILNPWAGRGKAGRRKDELTATLDAAGIEYELILTTARGHAIDLARDAVLRGAEVVVGIGGDGTLNETVNGVYQANQQAGRNAAFGIIPMGTGSDFIKVLATVDADDIVGGVKRLQQMQRHKIDLGLVKVAGQGERCLINAVGIGFDAQAAAEALKITWISGWPVYYLAIFRALMNYKPFPMHITYNDQKIVRPMMFATIANGRNQGASFLMTPDAHIDDGMLDVCMVDMLSVPKVLKYIPFIEKGEHTNLKEVTMATVREIRVQCDNDLPEALDGEVFSTSARDITVTNLHHAIDLLV